MKTRKELVIKLILEKAIELPNGFTSTDAGKDRKYAGKVAKELFDAGRIFRAGTSQNVKLNYFRLSSDAERFTALAMVLNSKPHQHLANPVPQSKESALETAVQLAALPAPAKVKRWPGLIYPPGFRASIKLSDCVPLNPAKDCAMAPVRRAVRCNAPEVAA